MSYKSPTVFSTNFTCPHCGVLSKQDWWWKDLKGSIKSTVQGDHPIRTGVCHNCSQVNIWFYDKMYYPDKGTAPTANADMPERVLQLYSEASSIVNKSPRGAAALLRLSIQVLCKELGESGQNINADIGNLVKKGLPEIVQKSLDIVRVTGNDAVHPGQIDTDDSDTVSKLFTLVNVIVDYTIALPKRVDNIFEELPADKRDGIRNRDKRP